MNVALLSYRTLYIFLISSRSNTVETLAKCALSLSTKGQAVYLNKVGGPSHNKSMLYTLELTYACSEHVNY